MEANELTDDQTQEATDDRPYFLVELSPIETKVLFGNDDEWAIVRSCPTHDQVKLNRQKKKLEDLEYAVLCLDCSIVEWTLTDENGEILPIPKTISNPQMRRAIWDKVPFRWLQRMAMAYMVVNNPGGDASGGLSFGVLGRANLLLDLRKAVG